MVTVHMPDGSGEVVFLTNNQNIKAADWKGNDEDSFIIAITGVELYADPGIGTEDSVQFTIRNRTKSKKIISENETLLRWDGSVFIEVDSFNGPSDSQGIILEPGGEYSFERVFHHVFYGSMEPGFYRLDRIVLYSDDLNSGSYITAIFEIR